MGLALFSSVSKPVRREEPGERIPYDTVKM